MVAQLKIWFFLAFLFFIGPLMAEPSLTVSVTPTTGSQDDSFLMTLSISEANQIRAPLLSGGEKFQIKLVGREMVQSSTPEPHLEVRFHYQLIPQATGVLVTPAIEVQADNLSLKHPGLEVQVTAASPQSALQSTLAKTTVFLKQDLSKQKAYVGEQITHYVRLFFQVDLSEPKREEPALDGFWVEKYSAETRSQKFVNGRQYAVLEQRQALFPLRPGVIEIPKHILNAQIEKRSRSAAHDMWSGFELDGLFDQVDLEPLHVESAPLSLEVFPLPASPYPLPSAPLVGKTDLTLSYPLDVIKVGESKPVTIEIKTTANANSLQSLPLAESPTLRVYAEKPETSKQTDGQKLITKKKFHFSLVPLKSGLVRLPGVELPYFDPETQSWLLARTDPIAFAVQGGTEDAPSIIEPNKDTEASATPPVAKSQDNSETPIFSLSYPTLFLLGVIISGIYLLSRVRPPEKDVAHGLLSDLKSSTTISELDAHFRAYLSSMVSPLAKPPLRYDEILRIFEERGLNRVHILEMSEVIDLISNESTYRSATTNLAELKIKIRTLLRAISKVKAT